MDPNQNPGATPPTPNPVPPTPEQPVTPPAPERGGEEIPAETPAPAEAPEETPAPAEQPALSVVHSQNQEETPAAAPAPVEQPQPTPPPVLPVNVKAVNVFELGSMYGLPIYHIVEGVGIQPFQSTDGRQYILEVPFVRGSKLPGGEAVEKKPGIVHEALVQMMITDLEHKRTLVPSTETDAVLIHLTAIADLFEARQKRRQQEGTLGTMKQ